MQAGSLNNTGRILHILKSTVKPGENTLFQNAVDNIILQEDENTKLGAKCEPKQYDNMDIEIDEEDRYELIKIILDVSHRE